MSVYGATKAALRMFVRTWIQDVKGSGIRINMRSPGAIDTPSLRKAFADASGPENVDANVKRMGEGSPLGRLGDPREIGKAAVFLASDQSSFITGGNCSSTGASLSPAEIRPAPAVSHRDACADISVRCDARLVAGGPRSRTTQGKATRAARSFRTRRWDHLDWCQGRLHHLCLLPFVTRVAFLRCSNPGLVSAG